MHQCEPTAAHFVSDPHIIETNAQMQFVIARAQCCDARSAYFQPHNLDSLYSTVKLRLFFLCLCNEVNNVFNALPFTD